MVFIIQKIMKTNQTMSFLFTRIRSMYVSERGRDDANNRWKQGGVDGSSFSSHTVAERDGSPRMSAEPWTRSIENDFTH